MTYNPPLTRICRELILIIAKNSIELKDKLTPEHSPIQAQQQVLQQLLEKAENTDFGKHYHFSRILRAKDMPEAFAAYVPVHDYEKIYTEWWHRLLEGSEDVTWPGRPPYFALSAGTTGSSSKRIPVTDAMLDAIRTFEKEIMMLGSSTDLKNKGNFLEGEISGISASNIPFWFKSYYKPGDDIAKIDNWDERVQKIAEQAGDWDIGALSGIPSWIELMLKKVIDYHQLKNMHEILNLFPLKTKT